jgi:predicted methyltransferase
MDHYRSILSESYKSLKPGGTLTLSAITDAAGLERIFQASFEALQAGGHMDQMKHQFHHVKEFELAQVKSPEHVILDRVTLRSLTIETGFIIVGESELHQEATTTLLTLKK